MGHMQAQVVLAAEAAEEMKQAERVRSARHANYHLFAAEQQSEAIDGPANLIQQSAHELLLARMIPTRARSRPPCFLTRTGAARRPTMLWRGFENIPSPWRRFDGSWLFAELRSVDYTTERRRKARGGVASSVVMLFLGRRNKEGLPHGWAGLLGTQASRPKGC